LIQFRKKRRTRLRTTEPTTLTTSIEVKGMKTVEFSFSMRRSPGSVPNQDSQPKRIATPTRTMTIPATITRLPVRMSATVGVTMGRLVDTDRV
jgi:hypothetical protein